jgi:hypothetical protein
MPPPRHPAPPSHRDIQLRFAAAARRCHGARAVVLRVGALVQHPPAAAPTAPRPQRAKARRRAASSPPPPGSCTAAAARGPGSRGSGGGGGGGGCRSAAVSPPPHQPLPRDPSFKEERMHLLCISSHGVGLALDNVFSPQLSPLPLPPPSSPRFGPPRAYSSCGRGGRDIGTPAACCEQSM